MGPVPRIALALLLALNACGDKDEDTTEGGPVEPPMVEAKVPGDGLVAGHYRIVRMGATATKRKGLGLKWDIVGPAEPDARFDVLIDGKKVGSCRGPNDDLSPTCTPKKALDFAVKKDTVITLAVFDRDVSGDEAIGEAHLSGLDRAGKPGPKLPMQVSGKLRGAWVQLVQTKAPQSMWARYKIRVIGLAGGITGALLLMFLFKSFWFDDKHYLWPRTIGKLTEDQSSKLGSLAEADVNAFSDDPATGPPDVVEVVKVRCQFCAALLDENDHTCHKCGGSV